MSPSKLDQAFRVTAVWARELARASKGVAKTAGWLLVVCVVAVIAVTSYESLDNAGWISRSHDTPVWIQGDWLVGEYRECDMQTTTPIFEDSHYDVDDLKTLPRLFCAKQADGFFDWSETITGTDTSWQTISGDFHILSVSYFGRLERLDKWRVSWRCQRNNKSLTCKAQD